jgi:hypothetical protein
MPTLKTVYDLVRGVASHAGRGDRLTMSTLVDEAELSDEIREKTRNHLSLQRDARDFPVGPFAPLASLIGRE